VLTLDSIFVYRDEKNTKLRSSYPLSEVEDLDLNDGRISNAPSDYVFVLRLESTKRPEMYFCLENAQEMKKWIDELNWRIQATHRVYKEDDDSEGLTVRTGDSLTSIKKTITKFKKKVEKKEKRGVEFGQGWWC